MSYYVFSRLPLPVQLKEVTNAKLIGIGDLPVTVKQIKVWTD